MLRFNPCLSIRITSACQVIKRNGNYLLLEVKCVSLRLCGKEKCLAYKQKLSWLVHFLNTAIFGTKAQLIFYDCESWYFSVSKDNVERIVLLLAKNIRLA